MHTTDTLRGAVVFLHAALEECFRSLYEWKMPLGNADFLDTVPMVGSRSVRPEKFFLGSLAAHRGKSIQDVITESVHAQAMAMSVNNAADISSLLRMLGLHANEYEQSLARISIMIERRHHIVHQADKSDTAGRGIQHAKSLNAATVEEWINVVDVFCRAVIAGVPDELV